MSEGRAELPTSGYTEMAKPRLTSVWNGARGLTRAKCMRNMRRESYQIIRSSFIPDVVEDKSFIAFSTKEEDEDEEEEDEDEDENGTPLGDTIGESGSGGRGEIIGRCEYHERDGVRCLQVFNFVVQNFANDDFRDYAEVCFQEFGNRVKHWITLNEPWSFSYGGYALGTLAPGRGYFPDKPSKRSVQDLLPPSPFSFPIPPAQGTHSGPVGDPGTEPYVVSHHQLLAHAYAVQLYRNKYQATQKGTIGIALVTIWTEPYTNTPEDKAAAERAQEFWFGWFMDPVTFGDYPASMRKMVGNRLPSFTKEESALLKGSFEFLGLNYYTANYVEDAPDVGGPKSHYVTDPLVVYHRLDEVNDPKITLWKALFDHRRVAYHHDHLIKINTAIK
ncbi:hypothetical protein LguiA_021706 [Lonicera macranthoides]